MSVFLFHEYKSFLRDTIEKNREVYGYQTRLSEAAGCQKAYMNQVVRRDAELTLEHAIGLCEFWKFDDDERDYFLLLVQKARASSKALEDFLDTKLKSAQRTHLNLAHRFKQEELATSEKGALYYSHWLHTAVHALTAIPEFQTADKIAARLSISEENASRVLMILRSLNLVTKDGERWVVNSAPLHTPRESPLHVMHLLNWRLKAIDNSTAKRDDAIHYTALHALSRNDAKKLSQMVLELLDKSRAVVGPSVEEDLVCVNLDFFTVR